VIVREAMPKAGTNLRVLRLEGTPGAPRQTEPLVPTTVSDDNGEISPDGHWLAYQSNPSGLFEISVRPFPNVDSGHWQVSTGGGTRPVWARSGKELFYLDGANAVTAVPIYTAPTFSAGTPTKLIDGRYVVGAPGRTYDVSADGAAVPDDQGQHERQPDVHASEHGRGPQLDRRAEDARVPALKATAAQRRHRSTCV
jgi:hypothetical protein